MNELLKSYPIIEYIIYGFGSIPVYFITTKIIFSIFKFGFVLGGHYKGYTSLQDDVVKNTTTLKNMQITLSNLVAKMTLHFAKEEIAKSNSPLIVDFRIMRTFVMSKNS